MKASYNPNPRNAPDSSVGEPQQVVYTDTLSPQFQSVEEQDEFLALWMHRYDHLWAEHPDPSERPDWKTESRYPLSDRLIQQGAHLYGVRFGKLTRYLVLDIDRNSAYHPCHDPFAIRQMLAALEVIGLVAYVAVTSSYSSGLHLYLPFAQEQKPWAIALVVSTLLEQAGFKLKPGQLESFPNPRPYTSGTPSLYNGHRLPLQAGSYLLNQHWEQVYTDQAAFVQQWQWAEQRNDLHSKTVEHVLKQAKRQRYKVVTVTSQKFLNDLDTEVERGWTEHGQTTKLLGRIAMREYIFGHILRGGAPLTGQALVDAIVEVAMALPGYTEHCRHQHEIHKKAAEWARSIEASPKYYPYDPSKRRKSALQPESQPANNIVSFQQSLALDAARRIQAAITQLNATDNFPTGTTARADAIVAIARCSKQTLNKHKELWHPDHKGSPVLTVAEPVTAILGNPDALPPETLEALPEGSVHDLLLNKFMPYSAAPQGQADRLKKVGGSGGFSTGQADSLATNAESSASSGDCNLASSLSQLHSPVPLSSQRPNSPKFASPVLGAATAIAQTVAEKRQRRQEASAARMQQWLESGDPILVKEAQARLHVHADALLVDLPSQDQSGGS
ncbi:hypothetical protein H6F76_02365 [Leptolyngbya sp. FACHB-321]|uniref:hypothetical protein n=1 Tax=Leptolyngbya sp. FACHB-321 TaxID=2692807 RepID=UPI0016894FF4|nr:hypothetical protein [Leptolyngbya sp. FACHB-321]MBD2033897.1 hypothetical protein [Leptolyngbya sp. FACHB-321]